MAVRTNGNNFQSGDRLKVELLPLELINERFYTQVSYRFNETIEEKDEDGKVKKKKVEKKIERQAGPILESLKAFQMISLDDSFHFGDASPTGRTSWMFASSRLIQTGCWYAAFLRRLSTLVRGRGVRHILRALKNVHHSMFLPSTAGSIRGLTTV